MAMPPMHSVMMPVPTVMPVVIAAIVPAAMIITVFALAVVAVPIDMPITAFTLILETAPGFKRKVFFLEFDPLKKIDFFILVGIDFSESFNRSTGYIISVFLEIDKIIIA